MKTSLLPSIVLLGLAAPLRAQADPPPAAAHKDRPLHYFFAYDYFLPENAGQGLKDQLSSQSATLLAKGYSSTQFSVATQGGAGARFGAFHRLDRFSDLGVSLGYVLGPTMNSNFNAYGGPGTGGTTINRSVAFLRYLIQAHLMFPIDDRWSFTLGSGFGFATGRVQQSCDSSGTVSCPVSAARRTWTGFSWEFAPNATYRLKTASLRVGARYAGFPTFDGNDQIARIEWTTYGFFVGASF